MKPYRTVYLMPVLQDGHKIVGWRWSVTDDGHEVATGKEKTLGDAMIAGRRRKEDYEREVGRQVSETG